MKILFYVEPWIEKSNPQYRKFSLLKDQHQMINTLLASDLNCEIHVVFGDGTLHSTESFENEKIKSVQYHCISQQELRCIFPNYKIAANKLYNNTHSEEEKSKLIELYKSHLGDFKPDIIIAFESISSHFNFIFPESLTLTHFFSVFSREPFPRLHCLDAFGIFKDSFMVKHKDMLNDIPTSREASDFMNSIRKKYVGDILNLYDPTKELFNNAKGNFKKVVMLPLQGSDYFAFEENHDALNQFDFICHCLDRISPEIGVLVTEHTARERVVNEKNINYLRNKYPNFIYEDRLNDINFHSQFLLPNVDGVIFTSSSVGIMGALMQKPVFQVGKFESFVSSSNDLTLVGEILNKTPSIDKDPAFHYLFTHYYHREANFKNPNFLSKYLTELLEQKNKNKEQNFYPRIYDDNKILNFLLTSDRKQKMLDKLNQKTDQPKKEIEPKSYIYRHRLINRIRSGNEEYISFDVFDTLIQRPFHKPRALFYYIQDEIRNITGLNKIPFAEQRMRIEKDLRKEKFNDLGFWAEVTIEEVYKVIQEKYSLSDKNINDMISVEIQTEIKLCKKHDYIYEAYQEALKLNKKIIIITDIYLPRNTIEKILSINGYNNYHRLYVSSDYGVRKQDGKLYDLIIQNDKYQPSSILHIGDNAESDGIMAESRGINSYCISKSIDAVFPRHPKYKEIWESVSKSPHNSSVVGVIANHLFNDPDKKPFKFKEVFDGCAYSLGFIGLGPILFEFVKWLIITAKKNQITDLYFLSREGYIFKTVYDQVSKYYIDAPKSHYILASRRAVLTASMYNFEDILNVTTIKQNIAPLEYVLTTKLGLDYCDIRDDIIHKAGYRHRYENVDFKNGFAKLKEVLLGHKDIILQRSSNYRDNYLLYLDEKGLCKNDSNIAFIDIGYAGTIQTGLNKILDKSYHGLYLMTSSETTPLKEQGLLAEGFLVSGADFTDPREGGIITYRMMLELFLGNKDGSLSHFEIEDEDKVIPSFFYANNEESRQNLIDKVHKGICDFSLKMINNFNEDITSIHPSKSFIQSALITYFKTPSYKDASIVENLGIDNKIGYNRDVEFIPCNSLSNDNLKSMLNNDKKYKNLYKWGEGSHVVARTILTQRESKKVKPLKRKKKKYKKINIKYTKLERKMNKLVDKTDHFWEDASPTTRLVKPFLFSDRIRRRFRSTVLSSAKYFSKYR